MTFPTVGGGMSEEEKAALREEFLGLSKSTPESQPPKRGRGRPKGSRNKPRPSDYAPHVPNSSQSLDEDSDPESQIKSPLITPRLSTRDQREVAERLAGILKAGTGIGSVVRPYIQMTDEEADAVAIPLASYLIRQEATSKVATEILEQYDLAAFALALAAYVVRVFLDAKAERDLAKESEKVNVTPEQPRVVSDDGREFAGTVSEALQRPSVQSQEGEERPVSRQYASVSEGGWVPSQV